MLGVICSLSLLFLLALGLWQVGSFLWYLIGPPQTNCPFCLQHLRHFHALCQHCGRPPAATLEELQLVMRQLERLRLADEVPQAMYHKIRQRIEQQYAVLGAKASVPEVDAPPPETPVHHEPMEPMAPLEPAKSMAPPEVPPILPTADSLGDLLARFMEERNIRWGELIGGLLIVGSSLALIISLWSRIAAIAWVKFFLFTGVTGALYAMGYYTHRHWKLPLTSRGLLMTATLLVPLNLLAIMAFSRHDPHAPVAISSQIVAWVTLGLAMAMAGRILVPLRPWALPLGIIGPGMTLMLVHGPTATGRILAVACLPTLFFILAAGLWIDRLRQGISVGLSEVAQSFRLLGGSLFSVLLTLGFLLYRSHELARYLAMLAPLCVLLGAPLLLIGWHLWRRLELTESMPRVAAMGMAITGAMLGLMSIMLAWPNPASLLIALTLNGLGWLVWSEKEAQDEGYLLALPSLVLAFLVGELWAAGRISLAQSGWELFNALTSSEVPHALIAGFAGLLMASFLWRRQNRRAEIYALGVAVAVGAVSLILGLFHGFGTRGDPQQLCWLLGIYTLSAGFLAIWRGHRAWVGIGAIEALLFLIQLFSTRLELTYPTGEALLTLASAAAILMAVAWHKATWRTLFGPILRRVAKFSSLLAILILITTGENGTLWASWHSLWLGIIWAIMAWWGGTAGSYLLFRIAISLAVILRIQAFYSDHYSLSIELWQAVGMALAVLSFLALSFQSWLLRQAIRPEADLFAQDGMYRFWEWRISARRLVCSWAHCWDIAMLAALSAVLLILSISHLLTGMEIEFGTRTAVLVPWGAMGWGFFAALLLALVAALQIESSAWIWAIFILAIGSGAWLAAGIWASQRATATALCWTTGGYFLLASMGLWWRDKLQARLRGDGVTAMVFPSFQLVRTLVFLQTMPVLIFLSAAIAGAGFFQFHRAGPLNIFDRLGPVLSLTGPVILAALVLLGHALRERSGLFSALFGLMLNWSVTVGWLSTAHGNHGWFELLLWNLIASSSSALLILMLELQDFIRGDWRKAYHRAATHLVTLIFAALTLYHLISGIQGEPDSITTGTLFWSAYATVLALRWTGLWDPTKALALAGLGWVVYLGCVWGLCGLKSERLLQGLQALHAGYALVLGGLWLLREPLNRWGKTLRLPPRSDASLAPAMWLLTALSILVTLMSQSRMDQAHRVMIASLALVPLGMGLKLEHLQVRRWSQILGVCLVTLVMVSWTWAWIDPRQRLMEFMVAGLAALSVRIAVGIFAARRWPEWRSALERSLPLHLLAGALILALIEGRELAGVMLHDSINMSGPAILTLAGTLILAMIMAFREAFKADSPQPRRRAMVYGVEVGLGLLVIHLRATVPWLFSGFFQMYWPLLIMAMAYLGIAIAHYCEQSRLAVLSEPLHRSGVILPLLPALACWAMPSEVHYSLVLLAVGGLYGLVALLRRSFGYGLLSGLAANGALWYLLGHWQGFQFADHPQLWLIPPALVLLAAAQMNRANLSAENLTTLRYGALMMIYLSSTAEIFLRGVAEAPWLPLVLAGLSVAGVLTGILWQVRGMLFSGVTFLVIALITMLWHASAHWGWTWIWYVVGILLGGAILLLFALFEKRREEMLPLVRKLRQWDA